MKTNRHIIDVDMETLSVFPNGGSVKVYNVIDRTTADYARILSCALHFAKQGKQVVLTPKVDVPYKNPAYDIIYGSLRGTQYYGKCPDLCVNEEWYEHEGYTHLNPKTNFSNMCRRGFKQSNKIIIEECGLTDGYMLRSLEGQMKSGMQICEVWVHTSKEVRLLFKTES